jgi:hypothetical protein
MDPSVLTQMAQRYLGRAQPNPAKRPWNPGVSSLGGTPSKTPLVPEGLPGAPNVATRVSPGTVPPRKRGYRPEMRPV